MFQDALMESGGQITTRSRYFSILGIAVNSLVILALILWPLMHPLALPKQTMNMLLVAPAPPMASMPVRRTIMQAVAKSTTLSLQLFAPTHISAHIATTADAGPTPDEANGMEASSGAGSSFAIGELFKSTGPAVHPTVQAAVAKKVALSSGVMAGNKISGASPTYPAIARAARIQGTVVMAATISKNGTIENLRVSTGPPMLVAGALDAVRNWRYKPYLLNGEPVEVETTISVIFNLGN